MENLKFLNTQSVAQFKANVQTDEIKVLRNEQTGKCFFVTEDSFFAML